MCPPIFNFFSKFSFSYLSTRLSCHSGNLSQVIIRLMGDFTVIPAPEQLFPFSSPLLIHRPPTPLTSLSFIMSFTLTPPLRFSSVPFPFPFFASWLAPSYVPCFSSLSFLSASPPSLLPIPCEKSCKINEFNFRGTLSVDQNQLKEILLA